MTTPTASRRAAPLLLARSSAAALLLAGPTALAFFSGGYFDTAFLWAGLGAWVLVVVAALVAERPLPRSRLAWLALGGMAGLVAWTALSISWTPLRGPAFDDAQRLLLYLAALIAGLALLRGRRTARAVEPALALGTLVVIGYALSERLLPGLLRFDRSVTAASRLEQPLTYWNGMGVLAAMGLLLCARMTGDATRRAALRAAAAAGAVPLAVGLYLTFSRGALIALACGLCVLVAGAPARSQLRALAVLVATCAVPVLVSDRLRGVRTLFGSLPDREREGMVMLGVLVGFMVAAALLAGWTARLEARGGLRDVLHSALRPIAIAGAVLCAVFPIGLVLAQGETSGSGGAGNPARGATANRLRSLDSNRYDFWRVALKEAGAHPVEGLGAGGFRVAWLQKRNINYNVVDVHNDYLEALTELGLVGLALMLAFVGGVVAAAVRALRRHPSLTPGWAAGAAVWLSHSAFDWDWELPAVSLVGFLLAAALLAWSETAPTAGERAADVSDEPVAQAVSAGGVL